MSDQFPHKRERDVPKSLLDQSSALLEELAKLRQNIERDSRLETESFVRKTTYGDTSQDGYIPVLGELSVDKKSDQESNIPCETYLPKLSQPIYRFDYGHIGRENTQYSASKTSQDDWWDEQKSYSSTYTDDYEDFHSTNTPQTKQPIKSSQTPADETLLSPPCQTQCNSWKNDRQTEQRNEQRQYRRYDDTPVVIPIRQKNSEGQGIFPTMMPSHPYTHHFQSDDESDAIPWRFISRYENETILRWANQTGSIAIFLGWGAIACGTLIFIRSFFITSTVWVSYGLPVLALGALCLVLGIVLGILSEKMQQINDLKQSLTTRRILNKSSKEIAPSHEITATEYQNPSNDVEEHPESDDVYDRLIKLRSEINELIDECENS